MSAAPAAPPHQPLGVDVSGLERFACPQLYSSLLRRIGIDASSGAFCGYLARTEREDGTGRKIELAVAIIPPRKPATDVPVVYLHGGPGGDVVQSLESMADFPLAESRTLILFDQRGWGYTTPHLCEELGGTFEDLATGEIPPEESAKIEAQAYQDCLAGLKAQKADLTAYGTDATVRDLEAMRTSLKLETWNVYGGSYGTTVALAYLAAHPQRIRSVILDATAPPEREDFTFILGDFLRAHERVVALCRNQDECSKRFPDMEGGLIDAVEILNRDPVETKTSPLFGNKTIKLDGRGFLAGLHTLHYDTYSLGMIPLIIEAARARRADELSVISTINLITNQAIGAGANITVVCREHVSPDVNPAAPLPSVSPLLQDAMGLQIVAEFCGKWPARLAKPQTTPVNVTVPILILGGALDPITPPENGKFVAGKLGVKAQFVEFPFLAHGAVSVHPCADQIAMRFLDAPDAPVDAACVKEMKPPAFESSLVSLWGRWNVPASYEYDPRHTLRTIFLTLVLLAGVLVSIAIWPILWLSRAVFGRRPVLSKAMLRSSAVAVTFSVSLFLIWLGLVGWGIWQTIDALSVSFVVGVPGRAWPGIWLLILSAGALAIGFLVLTRESWRRKVGKVATAHRLVVIAALTAALGILLSGEIIPLRLF